MIETKDQLQAYIADVIANLDDLYVDFYRQLSDLNSLNQNLISIDHIERLYSNYNNKVNTIISHSKSIIAKFIVSNT